MVVTHEGYMQKATEDTLVVSCFFLPHLHPPHRHAVLSYSHRRKKKEGIHTHNTQEGDIYATWRIYRLLPQQCVAGSSLPPEGGIGRLGKGAYWLITDIRYIVKCIKVILHYTWHYIYTLQKVFLSPSLLPLPLPLL